MHLFVYYKFIPAEFTDLERAIRELQKSITQAFPQVKTGLLRRPDVNDKGQETWMETYEVAPQDLALFRSELQRLVPNHAIPQARAYEVFLEL